VKKNEREIHEAKTWFFDEIDKTVKPLTKVIKKNRVDANYQHQE
jgi:hypothetical protein